MSVRNIAILGCGGFIGSHLLERLLEAREYVIEGWDATGAKIRHLVNHSRFKFHKADISSDKSLLDRISEFDVVISLAAICNPAEYNTSPLAVIESNFTHVQNIVSACARGSTWLLHFSTCEVYGRTLPSYLGNRIFPQDDPAFELREDETPLVMGPIHRQRWSYAAAKQLSERYIFAHHHENHPIEMVYHTNLPCRRDGPIRYQRWGIRRWESVRLSADIAVVIKPLNDFAQQRKPPSKVLTYMASGLPTVCTPSAADRDILEHGTTGFFAYTKEEWLYYLRLLISDHALRASMGRAARKAALELAAIERIGPQYEALFDEVLDGS